MSKVELYAAPENGTFRLVAEVSSAWGGSTRVWNALCGKYLGNAYGWAWSDEVAEALWKLAVDRRLSRTERIVLGATFDRVLVDRPHFEELAGLFREFVHLHPPGNKVCNLPEQADVLGRLAFPDHGLDFEPAFVGWRGNTVSENLWRVRDDGAEESRPYDLARDRGHWLLFDSPEGVLAKE